MKSTVKTPPAMLASSEIRERLKIMLLWAEGDDGASPGAKRPGEGIDFTVSQVPDEQNPC